MLNMKNNEDCRHTWRNDQAQTPIWTEIIKWVSSLIEWEILVPHFSNQSYAPLTR